MIAGVAIMLFSLPAVNMAVFQGEVAGVGSVRVEGISSTSAISLAIGAIFFLAGIFLYLRGK